ncbi:MAG: GDSL-type esterase/lipase family protein [Bacilli bacterium]
MNKYICGVTMLKDVIFPLFIIFLIIVSTFFILLLIYIAKYLRISIYQKARQYSELNHRVSEHKIVFLGDSLTEFFKINEFFPNLSVYNRGIASDTTVGVLERLHDNVIVLNPKKVFVQIGTNDLRAGTKLPMIINNIQIILSELQSKLPNAQIYFLSLYPVNSKAVIFSPFFVYPRTNKKIKKINESIKTFCEQNNIPYINVFDCLIDEKGDLKKEYTVEGLHISYYGYTIIAKLIEPFLQDND